MLVENGITYGGQNIQGLLDADIVVKADSLAVRHFQDEGQAPGLILPLGFLGKVQKIHAQRVLSIPCSLCSLFAV